MIKTKIDSRRITLFLLFSFGITWAFALAIHFTGGLADLSLGTTAWFLMVFAMFSPALANVLTRWITKEGWKDSYLKVHLKQNRRYWLIAWVVAPILLLVGTGIYFVIFPHNFDTSYAAINKVLAQTAQRTGKPIPVSPQLFILIQAIQVILLAPILNSIATFGEEFGWRAYLLQKFMPLGARKATLIIGLIWGIWHWPFIYMGYEYGFDYPGFPWLGYLVFLWFTFIVSIFLVWLTLKTKSVWPAVISHAAVNGMAPLALLLVKGQPNSLLGPGAVGLLASLPFAILALILFLRSDVFSPTESLYQPSELLSAGGKA
ncbi:MAG: CPBP family intramembrane glutamic endopeptidase [Anaerolineales bacterium]